MKSLRNVLIVMAVICLSGLASAVVTNVAVYNLGENDPGAVAGNIGNDPTVDAVAAQNLTRNGAPTYSANVPGAGSSLSMSLDGSSYYILGAGIDLGTDNWGIECWAYSTDASNGGWAFAAGRYFIGQWGDFLWHRNGEGNAASAPLVTDKWVNMSLVRDNGVLTAYLDGVALATDNKTEDWAAGFAIGGRSYDGKERWKGGVDAVRLFKFEQGQFDAATDLGYIPEPATMILMGIGSLVMIRRKMTA